MFHLDVVIDLLYVLGCYNGECDKGHSCIDGYCYQDCNYTYNCNPHTVCRNGHCLLSCTDSTQCLASQTCKSEVCVKAKSNLLEQGRLPL